MFVVMNTPLQDLLAASQAFDFAIFVFHPDDEMAIRERKQLTVRDNVLFELGLFMGSIGRERCFFVAPEKRDNFRIPTDLAGVFPASYDSEQSNLDAAVGDACYRILQIIGQIGPINRESEGILYSSAPRLEPTDFRGIEARVWKGDKPTPHVGRGQLSFPGQGTINVRRDNIDGKFEIHLRPNGPKDPSFFRKREASYRRLRIRCEACSEQAGHVLEFVIKDEDAGKWLANQRTKVDPGEWRAIDVHFKVPTDVDLLFRIDDLLGAGSPGSISIRNLVITERD